jgi:hypothetical protein
MQVPQQQSRIKTKKQKFPFFYRLQTNFNIVELTESGETGLQSVGTLKESVIVPLLLTSEYVIR